MSKRFKISEVINSPKKHKIKDYGWVHEICTCWWNWEFNAMCRKIARYEKYHRITFAIELLYYIDTLEINSKYLKTFIYRDIIETYIDWYCEKTVYGNYLFS